MDASIAESSRFAGRADVIATDLETELVLLDPATREMFSLNPAGRLVWQELARCTIGELADRVTAVFDVDRPRARADVRQVVADLAAVGLIVPAHPPDAT